MKPERLFSESHTYDATTVERIARNVSSTLAALGEDPSREGLLKTPERVAKAQLFLTQGYGQDAAQILRSAVFEESYDEMILVKDIELYSMCEHHMVPFLAKPT